MDSDFQVLHQFWRRKIQGNPSRAEINLEKTINTLAVGPCYVFVLNLVTTAVDHVSANFSTIHGVPADRINTVDDIATLIHPDDLPFVLRAEQQYRSFDDLGAELIVQYKTSYNFRMKTAAGNYQLFNHQALVLEASEGQMLTALNIHTNIHHLTSTNNYRISMIGLNGNPSYYDIEVENPSTRLLSNIPAKQIFTNQEIRVISLLQKGYSSKQIADELYISIETVKTHRRNILRKAGCKKTIELINRVVV